MMAAESAPPRGGGPSIVWFRDDLRLHDNPALLAAADRGRPILALYLLDEVSPRIRPLGGAARWWLHGSLSSLAGALGRLGVPLILRRGGAEQVVGELAASVGAGAVFWNRRYGSAEREVDSRLKTGLRGRGAEVHSFAGSLLFEPWTIRTGRDTPFTVFTPFWRACTAAPPPRDPYPAPGPGDVTGHPGAVASDDLAGWALRPSRPDWAAGLRESWQPGETAARSRLTAFLADGLPRYSDERDTPARSATSRLSPHLRWGEISPFQVWHDTRRAQRSGPAPLVAGATRFLTELGWREFCYHVLFQAPGLATENLKPEFDAFPWPPLDDRALAAWRHGRTGVPLVDAGMRELWRTGSMHNRLRMVTASFLTKNLLIDWRLGEAWFWDTLVDADPASNPFGWQWVAGSGADAAPYFRIFNPDLQAARFDPDGQYVRDNVPEYGTADYPERLVDVAETRRAALAAYERVRGARRPPVGNS